MSERIRKRQECPGNPLRNSKLDELLEQANVLPVHVLGAILAYTQLSTIPMNTGGFKKFLRQMSECERYNSLLAFCQEEGELDKAIHLLGYAKLLNVGTNPQWLFLAVIARQILERLAEDNFEPEERKALSEIADRLVEAAIWDPESFEFVEGAP